MAPTAVIIGAGINGLCVADALLQRSWRVTVADRGTIPNPMSASYDRHRLIRAHYAGEPIYCRRIEAAFSAWEALWERIGARHYRETGMLALSSTPGDWTDRARKTFDQLAMPYTRLSTAEVARRYPILNTDDTAYGLVTESGGVLMADAILTDLAASLSARGATLVEGFEAETVDPMRAQARTTDGRVLQGDVLIAAAGTGIDALFGDRLRERFTPMRSTVLYIDPPPSWSPHLASCPCWISLGGEDGLWGTPPIAGIPMKIGCGLNTRPGNPTTERHVGEAESESILAIYRNRFAEFSGARVITGVANFWTMAPQGRFVFRQLERCYVLSACSGHGFKFGALTGQDIAAAITTGHVAAASRRMAGLAA